MVEIQSFEPYHVGLKLQAHVDLGFLGNKLRAYLKDKQYVLPSRVPGEFVASVTPVAQVLGTKEGVRVWFNISSLALNMTGQDPERVIQVFGEVIKGIAELSYDLDASIAFYEIVATIIVKSDARPIEKINNSVKINLEALSTLGPVAVDSLRIVNEKPTEEKGALILVVEPNPNNPEKSYSAKLQYRCSKPGQVEAFHAGIKEKILSVMKSIEGGE